jgi:hypothetical protein
MGPWSCIWSTYPDFVAWFPWVAVEGLLPVAQVVAHLRDSGAPLWLKLSLAALLLTGRGWIWTGELEKGDSDVTESCEASHRGPMWLGKGVMGAEGRGLWGQLKQALDAKRGTVLQGTWLFVFGGVANPSLKGFVPGINSWDLQDSSWKPDLLAGLASLLHHDGTTTEVRGLSWWNWGWGGVMCMGQRSHFMGPPRAACSACCVSGSVMGAWDC